MVEGNGVCCFWEEKSALVWNGIATSFLARPWLAELLHELFGGKQVGA